MKHIICYSGGHSSALVAIEVFRKYGNQNIILLNHDINANVEHEDIKRFKQQVAEFIGVPITYANNPDWETKDQFDISIQAKGFGTNALTFCTNRLKTKPFEKFLAEHFPLDEEGKCQNATIYYGFSADEKHRILRRSTILSAMGYYSQYPLAHWDRTIESTKEIGIEPPMTYAAFKHANCVGCLKGGRQHWYVVYCTRPDIWQKAKETEDVIEHSILDVYLEELEPMFKQMKDAGVTPTEHIHSNRFWPDAKKKISNCNLNLDFSSKEAKPCECVF